MSMVAKSISPARDRKTRRPLIISGTQQLNNKEEIPTSRSTATPPRGSGSPSPRRRRPLSRMRSRVSANPPARSAARREPIRLPARQRTGHVDLDTAAAAIAVDSGRKLALNLIGKHGECCFDRLGRQHVCLMVALGAVPPVTNHQGRFVDSTIVQSGTWLLARRRGRVGSTRSWPGLAYPPAFTSGKPRGRPAARDRSWRLRTARPARHRRGKASTKASGTAMLSRPQGSQRLIRCRAQGRAKTPTLRNT
jgi:hypothetical protein